MSIFKDKLVVVTGGAGFVGSHLVEQLLALGARVRMLDSSMPRVQAMIEARSAMPEEANKPQIAASDAGDLYDCERGMEGAFAVFNLAAHVAGVIYNQQNQLEMFERNMRLQTVPLQAAAVCGVKHFLQVSSVCVYAPEYNSPAVEADGHKGEPTRANNGYSWAKRMGEKAALWSDLPHVVIVRPSNIYGPRDEFGDRAHVIPALIRKVLHDNEVVVNGTGYERREFLYVEDAARGMIAAMERGQHGEAYNLGTDGETCVSIRQLVDLIQHTAGTDKPVRFSSDYDAGDPARWSDGTKAREDLEWEYQRSLNAGLAETIGWYREHHARDHSDQR